MNIDNNKEVSNDEVRAELVARVELAVADGYKTKKETQKRKKCSVCSKGYLGQDNSSTCGPTCRKRKSRR
jgi:rubrerythrin